jgi:hypothetical protein
LRNAPGVLDGQHRAIRYAVAGLSQTGKRGRFVTAAARVERIAVVERNEGAR